VTWREETKGRCRRASPPNGVCSRQDEPSLIPRSGSGLGCSWNGRMARRQRRTLPRPRCRRTCHGASSFGESSSVAHRNGLYEDAKGELGLDHYEGRSFRGWKPMCPWCWFASRLSSPERSRAFPPRPEKLPRGKRRIVTTCADGNRPERHFRDSFHHCAPGPSRASWPHGYPDAPCVTDRDRWDRLVHMPVNTDGRLPF